jgi:hypothetical protein
MERSLPEHFFKYTTRSTAEIVLKTSALRWSTSALLNDPYDLQFDMHLEIDEEKLKRMALDKLYDAWYGAGPYVPAPRNISGLLISACRSTFPKMSREQFDLEFGDSILEGLKNVRDNLPEKHAAFRQYAATAKVLCQSEVGDSLPMWTYYAEHHKGVVLRFKPTIELDSIWLMAKPIHYADNMPRLFDEEFLSNLSAGTQDIEPKDLVDRTMFTKARDWAHEREWRVYMGAGRDPAAQFEDLRFHPKELDAVILGCAMPEPDRIKLSKLCRSSHPHAQVLQARKDDHQFKLVFEVVPQE